MNISPSKIFFRGVAGQCPNCKAGYKDLFKTRFTTHKHCQSCGMEVQQDGFYLSALVINYGLIVFGYIIPLMLLSYGLAFPRSLLYSLMIFGSIVFPFWIYRWSWTLWLGTYYLFVPHLLPENEKES